MKIIIGSDHGGIHLKEVLKQHLAERGIEVYDAGTYTEDSCDYPDIALQVCRAVTAGDGDRGVLVCGTGIGMAIAANRHRGIRAAVLHDTTEARLTRAHNDANVACFGARTTGVETALDALRAFLAQPFEGGRHERRVAKIEAQNG